MNASIPKQELLFYYINTGDVDAVRALVAEGAHVGAILDDGQTPLHATIVAGCHDAFRALIDAGADVNGIVCNAYSPLACAVVHDRLDMCRELIDAGAGPGRAPPISAHYATYLSPYQTALSLGRHEMAWLLFERFGEDPFQHTTGGVSLATLVRNAEATVAVIKAMQTEYGIRSEIDKANTRVGTPPVTRPSGMSPL